MRDGRLQQRGQAPVSHLHQTGHPGLVLLLSGRRRRRRRRRTPSASLRASPRGRSGRTPPLPIGADCASSPPPPPPAPAPLPPPAVLGPSRPGPRSVEAMWAGSGSGVARGRPAALGSRVEGPVPAAHILPGQRLPGVRATWDRGRPSRESRSCRSFRQGSGVGSRGAGLQGP